jgi:hypothetical protein
MASVGVMSALPAPTLKRAGPLAWAELAPDQVKTLITTASSQKRALPLMSFRVEVPIEGASI